MPTGGSPGFWSEIGEYLYKNYVCLDLNKYTYFSLGAKNTFVAQIVWMCVLGCIIASFVLFFQRRLSSRLVSALLRNGCHDEESAKSAEDLGVSLSYRILYNLRRPSSLSKLIYYKGQSYLTATNRSFYENKNGEEVSLPLPMPPKGRTLKDELKERRAVDFKTIPLYIPASLTYRAELRYPQKKESFLPLVLALVLFPVFGSAFIRLFPQILSLADIIIGFVINF